MTPLHYAVAAAAEKGKEPRGGSRAALGQVPGVDASTLPSSSPVAGMIGGRSAKRVAKSSDEIRKEAAAALFSAVAAQPHAETADPSALRAAAQAAAEVKVVKALLAQSVAVDAVDAEGRTPLHLCRPSLGNRAAIFEVAKDSSE